MEVDENDNTLAADTYPGNWVKVLINGIEK